MKRINSKKSTEPATSLTVDSPTTKVKAAVKFQPEP